MRFFLPIFFLSLTAACSAASETPSGAPFPQYQYEARAVSVLTANEVLTVNVEIADDDDKRRLGLMNRKALPENSGMLFIFEGEAQRSFWMKDTFVSLDMIFVSKEGEIVYIERGTTPLSMEPVSPANPASAVLEVNAGWCERNGVNAGDKVNY